MNHSYNVLKMKANEVLERAVTLYKTENDPFYMTSLICGIGKAKVCAEGGEHNYFAVLEVIYEGYKKQPRNERDLDRLFFEGMALGLTLTDIRTLKGVLNILTLQLQNEKEHKAPFTVDARPLLAAAGKTADRLEAEGGLTADLDRKWLEAKRKYLQDTFGKTF